MMFSNEKNKEATALMYIFSAYPEIKSRAEKSLNDEGYFQIDLFKQQTDDLEAVHKVFSSLAIALFNKEKFSLDMFNSLSSEELNTAFEAIRYCNNDKGIYDVDEQPMILKEKTNAATPPDFLGQTQVAEMLKEHGIDMDRRKVSVYYKRGHLPSPNVLIGSSPGWRKGAIEKWIKDYEEGRIVERRKRN